MDIEKVKIDFIKPSCIYALGNGILILTNVESLLNKKIRIWKSVDCGKTWTNLGMLSSRDKLEKIIKDVNVDNVDNKNYLDIYGDMFSKIKEEMWSEHDKGCK